MKIDGVAQMVVVLTTKEMCCLEACSTIWWARFRTNIFDIKIFACTVCFNSAIALKGAMPFL